jgi:hypothetical protein
MKRTLLKVEDVSIGLQRALEGGRWPHGRRAAEGVGPDGTEYQAEARDGLVCVERLPFGIASIPIPEPEDVVWKPVLPAPTPPWWQFWK